MLKFEYHPAGHAVGDSKVEEWIQSWYEEPPQLSELIFFSTENVIYCGRMLLAQGKIPYLNFLYKGKPVEESVLRWPEGFGGIVLEWEIAYLKAKREKQ